MNTKVISLEGRELPLVRAAKTQLHNLESLILFFILLLIWFFGPGWMHNMDESATNINRSIWLLILISLISFLLILGLCWWILQRYWLALGLPSIHYMVSQFRTLSTWQQLSFYWASFALILLSALLCLGAIC